MNISNNITTPRVLNVGDTFACQIGNPHDSSGYKESTQVVVIDRQDPSGIKTTHNYLIREIGTNLIGQARIMYDRWDGYTDILYCTNARSMDNTDFNTLSKAAASLGF